MSQTAAQTAPTSQADPEMQPPHLWSVVLLDDEEHTYEYVIKMMQELFHHEFEKAWRIAEAVDLQGRAVCLTTHREHAELKQEQIHSFGPDRLIAGCKGAMSAVLEPVECEGDDGSPGLD